MPTICLVVGNIIILFILSISSVFYKVAGSEYDKCKYNI